VAEWSRRFGAEARFGVQAAQAPKYGRIFVAVVFSSSYMTTTTKFAE